jgi:hypothetical protein
LNDAMPFRLTSQERKVLTVLAALVVLGLIGLMLL